MPWNDQSKNGQTPPGGGQNGGPGGPWGSGPRQPWGAPPRGPKGPQGPDLEELMRQWRDRFNLGGGRGDGPRRTRSFALFAGIGLALWLASGVYVVNSGAKAVVTRFGALARETGPGLHLHLPYPLEEARVESMTSQRTTAIGDNVAESLMLTGDKSIIEINFTVLWQVENIRNYVFNVRDQEETVKAVAESAMREVIGRSDLEDVITRSRSEVEQATQELMQRTLIAYGAGVRVGSIQIKAARAPDQVNEAFQDVIRAGQDQIARRNEATAYANQVVPKARGEAAAMVQSAEAYSTQVEREAAGEAERFSAVLTEYRKAPRVTRERLYLETMERVLGGADKVIVGRGAGAVPIMPLDQLRSRSAAPAVVAAPPPAER